MRKNRETHPDAADADELIRLTEELERRNAALEIQLQEQDRNRVALLHLLEDLEREHGLVEQARREWTLAFDAIRDPVFMHDADFRVVRANRAYAARAGLPFNDFLGKPYWEIFPRGPGPLPGCRRVMSRSQADDAEASEEVRLETGEIFLSRSFTVRNEQGAYRYSVHVLEDVTEKRRAEAEQRTLSEAVRQAAEAVLVLDRDARMTYLNPAFYRLFGYAPEEVLGKSIAALAVPGDDEARQAPTILTHLRKHGQWTGEVRRLAKDGSTIPVLLSAAVLRDAHGEISGYAGTYLDLREIRRAEAALRESEEKFRNLVETTTDFIWEVDEHGVYTYASPQVRDLLGYAPEEIVGKTPFDQMPPSEAERMRELFKTIIANHRPFYLLENVNLHKNGRTVVLETSGTPLFDKTGVYKGCRGIDRDISQRKQVEEALRDEKLFSDQAVESLPGVFYLFDTSGHFVRWNRNLEVITGYAHEEVERMHPIDFFTGAERQLIAERIAEAFEKGESTAEAAFTTKDGRRMPFFFTGRRVKLAGTVYLIGMGIDISARLQAETALHRSNSALKTLGACNTALVHAQSESELLQEICRVIVEEGGYAYAWIGYPAADGRLRPMAEKGFEPGFLESQSWSVRDPNPCSTAIREGVTVVVLDAVNDPALAERHDIIARLGIGSIASFPLLSGDEAFGMLSIYSREREAFDRDELNLLAEMAEDLNFGILTLRTRVEHERLQEEHLKTAERLKETLSDTIRAVALTVEKRDPYTAGHQNKVADLCVAIGRELGLPEDRIEGMRLGATIHDIGKVYVPAEILNRPGRLTDAEFEIIKSHPQIGYEIVKDVKFPWPVAETIRQHHEHLDGSGYPRGLKGETIILEARILSVADTVEAMASHRPYRPARGIESGLEEIERHRGDWYDPAVVDACIRLFREKRFAFG